MIDAGAFIEAARVRGFERYAGVPCSFLTPFINYVIDDPALSYVSAANEGDAVAAACGAALGGQRAVAMMQNSGLGNAVSPLTSLAWVFRIPVLLIVTWRGQPGVSDEPQHALMGAITGRLLETMGVPWEPFPATPETIGEALARASAHMDSERRPYALLMAKGSVAPWALQGGWSPPRPAGGAPRVARMGASGARPTRTEALRRVVHHTPPERWIVVATTGYTGRELYALADRPNHLYVVGSMGCASSLALGLAMARPDWRVLVVDGDGAALMRMGNLATIGNYGGHNLAHLVLDNEVHDSTGGQATVAAGVDLAAVARACGYPRTLAGETVAVVDELLGGAAGGGPSFAALKIRPGAPPGLPRPAMTPEAVGLRLAAHLAPSRHPPRRP